MSTKKRLIVGIAVTIIAVLIGTSKRQDPDSQRDKLPQTVREVEESPRAAAPGPLAIERRQIGKATVRPPNAEEQKIADWISAARKKVTPVEIPEEAMPATKPRAAGPKSAPLSEAQQRALQKLRWGPGKDLSFRGDVGDATVRFLASDTLELPPETGSAQPAVEAEERVVRFLEENRELFLLKEPRAELTVSSVETDATGTKIIRLSQRFGGLEVWPSMITANVNGAGALTVVMGAYCPTPASVSLTSVITAAEAVSTVRRRFADQGNAGQFEAGMPRLKIFADKGRSPELAFEVLAKAAGRAERVFVSATSGSVLLAVSEICHAGINVTVPDAFGQNRTINVFPAGTPTRYLVVDTSKQMYNAAAATGVIAVYDARTANPPLSSSASPSSGFDPIAVSAAFNLGKAYDFFVSAFQRNSYDGRGSNILGLVRVFDSKTGGPLANAFWSGSEKTMNFGSADAYAAATDIVGHEFSHAVVQNTANLIYSEESGALNESFSDILGESLERYVSGSNDWLIGTSLRQTLRSLRRPQDYRQPNSMSQYLRTKEDQGGVHTNSGISNYAFYLLAEGLPGGAIGFDPARNIFYRALATKLNSRSDFQDLRSACVQSARELFGAGSLQASKTAQAFDAVEIYDAETSMVPDNLTPPSGPDSYLVTYLAVDGNTYLGRREAALGDGNGITRITPVPLDRTTRASVSGDGSEVVFVSATRDVVLAKTNGSGSTPAGGPGRFNSATLSADGKYFACIGRDVATGTPLKQIIYINTATSQAEVIDLYLPVADGPNTIALTLVDEIDLSPDGQLALFDGFAKTTLGDGTSVQGWALFGVDLRTKAIFSLLGPLPNLNLGNPAFARTSEHRIIFEADDTSGAYIFSADVVRGRIETVRQFRPANQFFAYPRFSAGDDFVVFTDQFFDLNSRTMQPTVSRISLTGDRITPMGTPSTVQNFGYSGTSYRRGTYLGAPTLTVSAVSSSIRSGQTGFFRVTRASGDQAIRVPLSFKLLGTARPAVDYTPIGLSIVIPAGARSADVPIRAISPAGAPSRSLTLSLDPQFHYLVSGSGGQATMAIAGASVPTIVTHPASQTVSAGAAVTLAVTVSDGTGVTYQWYRNGVAIAGATGSSLTLRNLTLADAGSYTCVISNAGGSVTSSAAVVSVSVPSVLSNLSVRTNMSSGQTLIVGAVLSGGPKRILIRAAGPALNGFGLQGMADPRLELYAGGPAPITVNDDWSSALTPTFAAVGAFAFPAGSRDAAINQGMNGSFTVQCKGTGPGVVLVEAYDAEGGSNPRLVNLSARNQVGVGSNILIAGFTVSGTGNKQILIRGVGPTLTQFGVSGALSDPRIQVFDGSSRMIAENDNWAPTLSSTFSAVGAFALVPASRDAALLVSVAAGASYTVQVSGVGGVTGEALVEVYEVP